MILQTFTLAAFSLCLKIALSCASLYFHNFLPSLPFSPPDHLNSYVVFFSLLLLLSLATSTNLSLSVPFRPSHSEKNSRVNNRPDDKCSCDLQNAELMERGKERRREGGMVKQLENSFAWEGGVSYIMF